MSGWHWGNYIYKFIPLPWSGLSWTEAERYCKEMERGHLLSIRTVKENRWMTSRIRQIRRVVGFSKFWIGASDIGHQGVYEWTERNSAVTYTRSDTAILTNVVLENVRQRTNEPTPDRVIERVNERLSNEQTNGPIDRTSKRANE